MVWNTRILAALQKLIMIDNIALNSKRMSRNADELYNPWVSSYSIKLPDTYQAALDKDQWVEPSELDLLNQDLSKASTII